MEKDFILKEQAIALMELDFNEGCLKYCWNDKTESQWSCHADGRNTYHYQKTFTHRVFEEELFSISIPTYAQAFRWFRDTYNFHHYIEPIHRDDKVKYEYCVVDSSEDEKEFKEDDIAPTYEDAELECLKKLIEIVKQK